MGKFLVIVESPTKAKTINRYLGNEYIVKSSLGHIRDLSSNSIFDDKKNSIEKIRGKDVLINRIGIDPYRGWLASYAVLPGKEDIVDELNILAKESDHIYLATDLDREGEAIAWHLKEVIMTDKKISRVVFNEITYNAITQAFKHPSVLNMYKVYAQQTRRFMDRLVGYMVSPLLWKKVARRLSAGRVQSVVVRLIVDRERKIKSFVPKEYWELHAHLIHASGKQLVFQVMYDGISRFVPNKQVEVQRVQDMLLEFTSYTITNRLDKVVVIAPSPPFITSTLQQSANLRFRYSIKKTMLLAQRLYERGYITYMRTDSINVSQNALKIVRSYISAVYGQEYLSEKVNKYISESSVQDAHEAIRPSDIYLLPESIVDLDSDLRKLYQLIWCQFIASQMKPSQHIVITLLIEIGNFQLRARGRMCSFDGWKKVVKNFFISDNDQDSIVPDCKIGDVLMLKKIVSSKHFTKPPMRYNEASLVKELEKRGIGRPSTYVPIISTIQGRGYVYLRNSNFYATKIGEIVTDRLFENFHELMDYKFTANMENILDRIADRQEDWKVVLDTFFIKLIEQLNIAEKNFEDGGMRPNSIVMTSILCSLCGRNMGIRTAMTGVFLSCEGYNTISAVKDRCKNTINLVPDVEIYNTMEHRVHNVYCEKCNGMMDQYFIDNNRKLYVCTNSPLCNGYMVKYGMFLIEDSDNLDIQCEKCMRDMSVKFGRFGKYLSCNNLHCKNTRRIVSDFDYMIFQKSLSIPFPELLCKQSDAYFVLRNGKAGIFLAAHTFPQSRETRAPSVEELVRFRKRLPKKLSYLADAPMYDNFGNKTVVRFSRKNRQQYIVSEENGKLTGWKSFFIGGQWKVIENE